MALRRHVEAFRQETRVLASLSVGQLWDRLLNEFLQRKAELDRQGLPTAEVEREMAAFLDGLSDRPIEDLARTTSGVAYNEGREAELLTANEQGKASFVVRSEILDRNTCEPCSRLDGSVFEIGSADFHKFQPPAECLGRDRCRGFYVPIANDLV